MESTVCYCLLHLLRIYYVSFILCVLAAWVMDKWTVKKIKEQAAPPLIGDNNVVDVVIIPEDQRRRNIIKDSITEDLGKLLLAWPHTEKVSPDFIVSSLGKFVSPVLEFRDKWQKLDFLSPKAVYGGVIAEFETEQLALDAAKEMSMKSRSVMTLQVSRLLDLIIEAEIRHPEWGLGLGTTRVLVSGKKCLKRKAQRKSVKETLGKLGDVVSVRFSTPFEHFEDGVVCEVVYSYVSQAYAAMLFYDGLFYKQGGRYSAKVEETLLVKEIKKKLRVRMIDYLDENRVLHV